MSAPETSALCIECSTPLTPELVMCPACLRLVYQERLKQLARNAEEAANASRLSDAMAGWRQALELLPVESRQAAIIRDKLAALRARVDAGEEPAAGEQPASAAGARRAPVTGILGALGVLAWKLKFALTFVLTKLKFLLYGLSKGSTLLSMLVFFGAYWSVWGWKFAAGMVVSIYVHEMGHVAALTRYGIHATAPMFIPGLGALIRLKQYPTDPIEDAQIGLAGPLWGLGACLGALAGSWVTGSLLLSAIAKLSAWINLFNMIPLGSLDGGRGFRALCRWQRWACASLAAGLWYASGEGLLALVLAVALFRSLDGLAPAAPARRAFPEFLLLLAALTLLSSIKVDLGLVR